MSVQHMLRFITLAVLGLVLLLFPLSSFAKNKPTITSDTSPVNQSSTSAFGEGWVAIPLKKDKATSFKKEAVEVTSATTAIENPLSDPNQVLKPAEGFIAAIEKRLMLLPHKQENLTDRLNHIQIILYGHAQFSDAGQLLSEISKTFPEAAIEARQQLMQDISTFKPDDVGRLKKTDATPATKSQRHQTMATTTPNYIPNQAANYFQPVAPHATGWEKPFDENWDDDFDKNWHDYQAANNTAQKQSRKQWEKQEKKKARFESLKSLGQGIASLAMVAAPIAGEYYLNKQANSINTNRYNNGYNNYNGYNGYNIAYPSQGNYYGATPVGYPNYYPAQNGLNPNQYGPYGSLASPYGYTEQYPQQNSLSRLNQINQLQSQQLGW